MSSTDKHPFRSCADCSSVLRTTGKTNCYGDPADRPQRPGFCPSGPHAATINRSFAQYLDDDDEARLAFAAAKVEGLCYKGVTGTDLVAAHWTRVEDLVALARLMGYQKIGIATCIGLLDETQRLRDILQAQGLLPLAVCCKAGSIDKSEQGLADADKIRPGHFEAACNPIAQARICNEEGTDMNVIVGLCVGHDMLFNKYSEAPVTTLVVKDRVTGHNPVAVLYGQNAYYKRLQKAPVMTDEEVVRHRQDIEARGGWCVARKP
jgi:uncharacterized metal-binding protein